MHQRNIGGVDIVRCMGAGEFLVPDHLLKPGQAEAAIILRPRDARPAMLILLALPIAVEPRRGGAVRGTLVSGNVG